MQQDRINTVIFDLGGVLIDWNPMYVYENYFKDEAERAYFFEHVATFEWNEEQDAGKSLQLATEERIALFPEWRQPLLDFYGRWEEMLGDAIMGTVDILSHLRSKDDLGIYALSNWSAETFPVALKRFEFLQWFDARVISGEEGLAKPDPSIYKIFPERYKVEPSKALFIDDNHRNILAAEALGFQTVHFQGPDDLQTHLKVRGLLS